MARRGDSCKSRVFVYRNFMQSCKVSCKILQSGLWVYRNNEVFLSSSSILAPLNMESFLLCLQIQVKAVTPLADVHHARSETGNHGGFSSEGENLNCWQMASACTHENPYVPGSQLYLLPGTRYMVNVRNVQKCAFSPNVNRVLNKIMCEFSYDKNNMFLKSILYGLLFFIYR